MQTDARADRLDAKLERISGVLRLAGWLQVWIQVVLLAAAALTLLLAVGGQTFTRAIAPNTPYGASDASGQTVTPGLGISIFFAIAGIVTLLVSLYLAFRQTRLAKRLGHPEPALHPRKSELEQILRLGAIVGTIGLLLAILGCGTALAVLIAKSVAQPQGVAIYDPTRIIRSLDVFVATSNFNSIAAHFVGAVSTLALLGWLHRQ